MPVAGCYSTAWQIARELGVALGSPEGVVIGTAFGVERDFRAAESQMCYIASALDATVVCAVG
jgi:hypothetical protein